MESTRHGRRVVPAVLITAVVATGVAVASVLTALARRRRHEEASRPADVGFMIAMHNAFRRDLAELERLTQGGGAPAADENARRSWESFRDRLHRHHVAEDEDLWPVLREHLSAPDDLARVDQMVQEHQALSTALDEVDQAVAMSPTSPTRAGGPEPAAAVERLGRLLRDHLEHEEREVLPLVQDHLTRSDWRTFLVTERRQTPVRERPDFLGWVLDDANPADTRAVLSELPPPGRLAYRVVIAPRYRGRRPGGRDG